MRKHVDKAPAYEGKHGIVRKKTVVVDSESGTSTTKYQLEVEGMTSTLTVKRRFFEVIEPQPATGASAASKAVEDASQQEDEAEQPWDGSGQADNEPPPSDTEPQAAPAPSPLKYRAPPLSTRVESPLSSADTAKD